MTRCATASYLFVVVVGLLATIALSEGVPQRRHNPGAPRAPHADPVLKTFSLSSACSREIREICALRSPHGDKAIACLDAHRGELSAVCAEWHDARLACVSALQKADYTQCEECREACTGAEKSLMHCLRRVGVKIAHIGVGQECTATDFYKSMTRAYRKVHQMS